MLRRQMSVYMCYFALAMNFSFQNVVSFGQATTSPANGNSDAGESDAELEPGESTWTAENYRMRADGIYNVKHDYAKALLYYHKGIKRFPKSVRILVSLSAVSIDYGYQHSGVPAGRAAYEEARKAINSGLRIVSDGNGEDLDDGAKETLTQMANQLPAK